MKVLVTIPVYVTNDALYAHINRAIDSVKAQQEVDVELMLVVNRIDPKYADVLLKADIVKIRKENIVSGAWNDALIYALQTRLDYQYEYMLIMNQDVVTPADYVINSIRQAIGSPIQPYIFSNSQDDNGICFACFFLRPHHFYDHLYTTIASKFEPSPGLFDENFIPAYYEDNDMMQRVVSSRMPYNHFRSHAIEHAGSQVIKTDNEMNSRNSITFSKNREYYILKWGGVPGSEKYDFPFNATFNEYNTRTETT